MKVYYCPHSPDALVEKYKIESVCRKPKLGMYEQAVKEFDIDISNSWAIGDKIRDLAICERTGCRGFLVEQNEKAEHINSIKNSVDKKIRYVRDLWEAANTIVEE